MCAADIRTGGCLTLVGRTKLADGGARRGWVVLNLRASRSGGCTSGIRGGIVRDKLECTNKERSRG
jgi:hypothetical protein